MLNWVLFFFDYDDDDGPSLMVVMLMMCNAKKNMYNIHCIVHCSRLIVNRIYRTKQALLARVLCLLDSFIAIKSSSFFSFSFIVRSLQEREKKQLTISVQIYYFVSKCVCL